MITHKNWLDSNFLDVAFGRSEKFQVQFHPYHFGPMDFELASSYTVSLLKHKYGSMDLYLGLTGGADSEYIARLLLMHGIPFTPVIVDSDANYMDMHHARALCDELKLKPEILRVSQREFLGYYLTQVAPYRSDGLIHVHQLMVVDHVKRTKGICILGETHLYDPDPCKSIVKAFKFLPDLRYENVIPFYYFTLEMTYAEMCEVREDETAQEFKARVRGTALRKQKIQPRFNADVLEEYHRCTRLLHPDLLMHDMGTTQTFVKYMENFIR